MKIRARQLALMAALAGSATSISTAQTLSTGTVSNNGSGGVFLNLTTGATPLNFNSFQTHFGGAVNATGPVEVWTRPGSYVGFDASSAGWTLTQTVIATAAGTTTLSAPVVLTTPILLPASTTTAVCLHGTTTTSNLRYFGTGTTSTSNYSNADLAMFTAHARTGNVPFGGSVFTPRAFVGNINYSVAILPTDPGACCKSDGTCSDGTFADCQTAGGVFQGIASLCASVTCTGACCKSDGTCAVQSQLSCEALGAGNVYQGNGSACGVCPATVACCKNDGTCSDLVPAACVASGGISQVAGSTCAGFSCLGACCLADGTCSPGQTQAACVGLGAGNTFQGFNSACGVCPATVSCCQNDGTCSNLVAAACAAAGGTSGAAGSSCATANCNAACCKPDNTCSEISINACNAAGGLSYALGSLCASVACPTGPFIAEAEPNETRPQATPVTFAASGDSLVGVSTGAVTTPGATSMDNFLLKTPAAAAGIYRHQLTFSTGTATVHTTTVRGLGQTAAPLAPWEPGHVIGASSGVDATAQTGRTVGTTRQIQWYGFGKQEQIYYRVTGTASTTSFYQAAWSFSPVSPTMVGSFKDGDITIANAIQGHTTDTELWLYDSNFNAIVGAGNDDKSTVSGGPLVTSAQSYFTRNLTPGTYYLAVCNFDLMNNQPSPSDDNFRTGTILDFPDAALNNSTTTTNDTAFAIADSMGNVHVSNAHLVPFDINWFRFDVSATPATGACCTIDGCTLTTISQCGSASGVYQGDGSVCGSCPVVQACCFAGESACVMLDPVACAAAGGVAQGAGSVCADGDCWTAPILWNNGPLNTGTVAGNGSVAPAGYAWSEVQADNAVYGNTNAGASALQTGFGIVDDFTITAPGGWQVDDVQIVAYQTSAVTTTSPFTAGSLQIWDGRPGDPGSSVVFGDSSTNRLTSTVQANLLRIFNTTTPPPGTATGTTRAMWLNTLTVNQVLPPGTYWIRVGLTSTSNFTPSVAVKGQRTVAGANALQHVVVGDFYQKSWDDANPAFNPNVQLEQNFKVRGSVLAPACYANCDASTTDPVLNVADFTCFLQQYAGGDPNNVNDPANCDESTAVPVLNVADFTCFLQKYAAGCP